MIRKILVGAYICMLSPGAYAATLSSFNFGFSGGWGYSTETAYLRMAIGQGSGSLPGSFQDSDYFLAAVMQEDDTGSVFSITGEDFDYLESYLTNGVDDYVGFKLCSVPVGGNCVGFASRESSRLGGDPDFAGKTIESLELELNQLTLDTPGRDPNDNGNWTDFSVNMNFNVIGIPIPAAVWLFGSALAGLGWMRRKQST